MAKTRKSRTQELLKEYIKKGKPVTLRNEILMLNERLIGWTAKHYKVDGYVEYEDLKQEGMIGVIDWMENLLTIDNAKFFSRRVLVTCCAVMELYKYKMMCQFSDEYKVLRKETRAFKEYIKEGNDEWDIHSLNTFIGRKYEELYGTEQDYMTTWFQERVDADEVAVEDKEFEIATSEEIVKTVYDMCHLLSHHKMALDAYLFNDFDCKMRGEGKTTHEVLFSEVAWRRGVSVSAIGANFRKAVKDMRDVLNIYLVERGVTMIDDLREVCGQKMQLHYLKDYVNDRDFEEEYYEAFPEKNPDNWCK